MSCRISHRWKRTHKSRVGGGFWEYSYACRGCAATKTEYHRVGMPSEEDGKIVFSILQAFVMSLMLWLLIGRFITFWETNSLNTTYNIQDPETPFIP